MGNAIAGYGGAVQIGANTVANVKQWEIPLASDLYDVSVLGVQWKQYIAGLLGAEAKVDVFFDLTDTNGQLAIQTAFFGGTTVALTLKTSSAGGAVTHTYAGNAFVKGIDIKDPVNAPEEAALTLTFTGPITFT